MSQDFDRALFQATFSTFLNQIFQKQLQANKIQLDLIRIYEGKTQNISTHLYIIKNCRKTIDSTDCIIKDIRDYFTDLKIPQVYCLFETLFRNLVYTLKTLSQCYLYRFDSNRGMRDKVSNQKIPHQTVVLLPENKEINSIGLILQKKDKHKQDARRMEQLDFVISSIQAKQSQLQTQMNLLIPNVKDEKQKIEKIDATIRSAYYQEMMKIFSDISNKAQYIFSNHLKAQNEQDTKNTGCMKPEDLEYQIYSQLRKDTKYIAKKKFQQIFNIIVNIFKEKLHKKFETKQAELQKTVKILKKEKEDFMKSQKSRKHVKLKSNKSIKKKQSQHDISIQKQIDEKLALKIQQNQNLIKENQQLKRQVRMLNNQIQQHKLNLKKQKLQYVKLQFQNKQLQKLFKKRTIELEQSKNELHVTINKRVRQSIILSRNSEQKPAVVNEKIVKPSKQQKETQTEAQNIFSDDLFNCSLAFQHKSFISMRTKHKNHSLKKEDTSNEKSKLAKTENNLKVMLEKISELLFKEKTGSELNEQDKHTIFSLIQSEKYDQAIQKMKEKLDLLFYTSLKSNNSITSRKAHHKKGKSYNKKNLQKNVNSSTQQLNISSLKLISFGVQTQQLKNQKNKKMVQNFTAIHSSYRQKQQKHNKPKYDRRKIASNQQFNTILNKQQNQIKTQRVSPIGSIISRFNSELDKRANKKQKQNSEEKRLINRFRNSQGQCFLKQNKQNQTESAKQKIKFLQNSLFEQINLNGNQSNVNLKRNIMMKTPRLKFKQNLNIIQRQERQQRKIVTEVPQENEHVQCKDTIDNNQKPSQVENIDLVVKVMKGIGMLKQFDEKNDEKLLIQAMKASSSLGQVKVSQAIKMYRQYQMSTPKTQKA